MLPQLLVDALRHRGVGDLGGLDLGGVAGNELDDDKNEMTEMPNRVTSPVASLRRM